MIEIEAPDGSIVEFPDGTPDDVINNAMRSEFGGPAGPEAGPESAAVQSAAPGAGGPTSPSPASLSAPPAVPPLVGFGGAVAQGFTGNFMDEILAGAQGAAGSPGTFEERRKREERLMDQYAKEHPWANFAGNVIGGAANPAFRLGKPLVSALTTGAVAGAGEGEDLADRAWSAGTGAALGGATHGVLAGAGSVLGGLKNTLFGPNENRTALGKVLTAIRRDMPGNAPIEKKVDEAINKAASHPDMTLADIGKNSQRLARTVETIPGVGSRKLSEQLRQRQIESGGRIEEIVRRNVHPDDARLVQDDLIAKRNAAAQGDYAKAYAFGPVHDSYIGNLIQNPKVKEGIKRGIETERNNASAEGRAMNIADYAIVGFDKAGAPIMGPVPNMRLLDTAKQGLDDIIEDARDPITGKLNATSEVRSIVKLRRGLNERMKQLNPDYKAAAENFEGPSRASAAISAGRNFLKGDIEDQLIRIDGMTPGEKEMFTVGIARQLREMIESGSSDTVDATRKLKAPKTRGRLEKIIGKPQLKSMVNELETEANMTHTHNVALTNSVTGRIAAEQEDAATQTGAQAAAELALDTISGGPVRAGASALRRYGNRVIGLTEGTSDRIAERLMAKTPQELSLLRDDLQKFLLNQRVRGTRKRALESGSILGGYNVLTGEN